MFTTLFIYHSDCTFSEFATRLRERREMNYLSTDSMDEAMNHITSNKVDLLILGEVPHTEEALSFMHSAIYAAPLLNCAMVSSLPSDKFHEITEGLGILMQLPPSPSAANADELIEMVAKITSLMGDTTVEEAQP